MDTRFKKGFSGNPAGRPRGSTNKATAFRVELERHGPAVLEVVVNAALKGDLTAARIVIDRICAPLRAVDSPVSIESEGVGDALADLSKSIVRAALDGKITPAVARTLAAALSSTARTKLIDEMEARLAALETRYEKQTEETGSRLCL